MTPEPYTLRDYQVACKHMLREEFRRGNRRALAVMPTGAGKTLTLSDMVGESDRRGKRVLWLVDREELAEQAGEAFRRAGVPHSFIMAGHEPQSHGRAFVGTIQSYLARVTAEKWVPEHIDLIVIDEAHRAEAGSFQRMLARYPRAYVVGLTATPMRGDGRGLGNTFDAQVAPVTVAELLSRGILVQPRYFIPSDLDFSRLKAGKGDFGREDYERMAEENPQLVGNIVEHFVRTCPERRAVAFPMTIAQSLALRDTFNAAGISAVHIDGGMQKTLRRELMEGFRSGEYQVLTSVNIAIEGLDVPDVSAVIMARPTRSQRIWVQAVGRGLRAYPGQTDCVVLDHAGAFRAFGPVEDFVPPALHARKGKRGGGGGTRTKKASPAEMTCEACKEVFFGARVCPACGHAHETERAPRPVAFVDGLLEEVTPEGRKARAYELEDKRRWWGELQGYVYAKGWKPGAAYRLYIEKFGEKPGGWDDVPQSRPSPEVMAWMTSRMIAFRHRQRAADHHPNAAD